MAMKTTGVTGRKFGGIGLGLASLGSWGCWLGLAPQSARIKSLSENPFETKLRTHQMSLPNKLKQQYLDRFDELIATGDNIFKNPKRVPGKFRRDPMTGAPFDQDPPSEQLDWPRLVEWRTKSATLLSQLPLKGGVHEKAPETFVGIGASGMEAAISILRALKDDFERGFLDNLLSRVEAEIASDYMGQAEKLLGEGMSGKYDHVPAAVLSGAVLERALRTLCDLQQPKIELAKPNGELKTINPLITDLKAANVFNETKAKQLRAWADIRNNAAHGDWDKFKKEDVEQMVAGISRFLVDYLS